MDGRYRYRICIGKDEHGKPKYKNFYAATARDAKRAADAYRAAISNGMDPAQQKAALATLYRNLIAVKTAKGISKKSLDRYEDNLKSWGDLIDVPAGDLKPADFQRRLNELASWHDGHPPLSHFTLSNLRSSAKAAYDLAIPEVVLYNPITKTTCPAGAPPEVRTPITDEQQRWIRETPHAAQRAAMLLLYSGLRRSEATALTWADVDLQEATIIVTKGYDFFHQKDQMSQNRLRHTRCQYPPASCRLSKDPAGRLPVCAAQPQGRAHDRAGLETPVAKLYAGS